MTCGRGRVRNAVLALLLLAPVVLVSCGEKTGSESPSAKLTEFQGSVTVDARPARVGLLTAGAVVKVGADGAARVELSDGTKLLLLGRSDGAEWSQNSSRREEGLAVILWRLTRGLLSFSVPGSVRGKGRYEIDGVSSVTVVRGTEGKIVVDASGDLVAIKSGEVEVRSLAGPGTATVKMGTQVLVPRGGAPGALSAYDFTAPAEQALFDVGPLKMKTLTSY